MANLDTRNKRGSAFGIDLPFFRVLPDPDGSVTQPDRQQAAWKYSAISSVVSGPTVEATGSVVLIAIAVVNGVIKAEGLVRPTFRTPYVRIYNLDTMSLVDVVNLSHLRYARVGQVYSLPLRLTTSYPVGRYGVLYQAPVGSFMGVSLSLFEVVAGGDAAGPIIASYTVAESTGDLVLGQLGSGAVVVGQKPGVT